MECNQSLCTKIQTSFNYDGNSYLFCSPQTQFFLYLQACSLKVCLFGPAGWPDAYRYLFCYISFSCPTPRGGVGAVKGGGGVACLPLWSPSADYSSAKAVLLQGDNRSAVCELWRCCRTGNQQKRTTEKILNETNTNNVRSKAWVCTTEPEKQIQHWLRFTNFSAQHRTVFLIPTDTVNTHWIITTLCSSTAMEAAWFIWERPPHLISAIFTYVFHRFFFTPSNLI